MFNPPICTMHDLRTCFGIFADSKVKCNLPTMRKHTQRRPPQPQTTIYFGGACNNDTKAKHALEVVYGMEKMMSVTQL